MSFRGNYFIAGSSKAHHVIIKLTSLNLTIIENNNIIAEYDIKDCQFSMVLSGIPVEVILPDKNSLHLDNTPELLSKISDLNIIKKYSPYFLENKWKIFIFAFIGTACILFLCLKYFIPSMSQKIAKIMPENITLILDNKFKDQMDKFLFKESELSVEKRNEITTYLSQNGLDKIDLNFRRSVLPQANAFALANKNIFFTDKLIEALNKKEYLLAVAYHEAGHLKHNHIVSKLIKDSFLLMFTFVFIGDLPGASDSLLQAGLVIYSHDFSRQFEKEADNFAIEKLIENNMSPKCFTEAMSAIYAYNEKKVTDKLQISSLMKIEREDLNKNKEKNDSPKNIKETSKTESLTEQWTPFVKKILQKYLDTHPSLNDRTVKILERYPEAKNCKVSRL